jgi:hypothetical protein
LKVFVKIVSGDILLKVICSVVEDELAPEGGRVSYIIKCGGD